MKLTLIQSTMSVVAGLAMLSTPSSASEALAVAHVTNAFEFTVHAPMQIAAPLFGAEGERTWSGGEWNPKFLYPATAKDIQGAVFTIQHGEHTVPWINTVFDLKGGHMQYVLFMPEHFVTLIDVHLVPKGPADTAVKVMYERTALRPEANEMVRHLGEEDQAKGKQWEAAINEHLKKQQP